MTVVDQSGAAQVLRRDDALLRVDQVQKYFPITGGGVLKRTFPAFGEVPITTWASALTYYSILSVFPALIALFSIVGLIGPSASQPLIDNLETFTPGPARAIVTNAINGLAESQGSAGVLFVVGLVAAIWSASAYVSGFMQASNVIYDVEEGRPVWKTLPVRIGTTIAMLLLLAVSAFIVVVTGPIAAKVGGLIGVGDAAVTAWDIAKWPVLLLLVSLMFAVLYWAAPNVRQPGVRWVTPGSILAVIVWIVASALFTLYVANFGSYNKTYGSLGAVITFLVWLWISNTAILLGAEFDSELQRARQIEGGHDPDEEPFLEPRDTRKMKTADG